MSFASLVFLYFFVPITLFGYYILPKITRNIWLLIANIVFYAWGEPSFLIVILLTTAVNFYAGYIMQRSEKFKKPAAFIAIIIDLLLLFGFKYVGFFADIIRPFIFWTDVPNIEIALPLGISFYTFQVMSYIIDVYRGDVAVQRSFTRFATYMTLFPQLIAGPIVRYRDIEHQLDKRSQNVNQFASGICQFAIGLGKKVLLANQMGALWESINLSGEANGVLGAWIGALAFTFQIYFDFSGYSDIACGLGKLFGFTLPVNFDYPYISRSITEFWRRWHISLSTWFRDYVYIPLGGSRVSKKRLIINVFAVWLFTGLWHGASMNFVVWGIYYGVLLIIEKLFLNKLLHRMNKAVQWIYTMILVMIGWVIFAFDDFSKMLDYLHSMFDVSAGLIGNHALVMFLSYLPLILICAFASLPIGKMLYKKIEQTYFAEYARVILCMIVFLLCTAALVADSYNPFLYSRF